jgi:predicted dehydrogenase
VIDDRENGMEKVRVGCIGAGGIARVIHLKAYTEHPNVSVEAVCDTDLPRARAIAAQFGIPRVFRDYRELLDEDLDAVSVCTPNAFHAPVSIAAMEAGKDVLCEKPMAMNAGEAKKIQAVAERTGRVFMLALNNRFEPGAAYVKDLVRKGRLGDIYHMRVMWRRRWGMPAGWFRSKKLAGGGCLIDLGVHIIDVAMYMANVGTPLAASAVTYCKFIASGSRPKADDVEDAAYALLRFPGGASMQMEITWASHNERNDQIEIVLLGDKGGASLFPTKAHTVLNGQHVDLTPVDLQGKPGHFAEIDHFVDCAQKRRKPLAGAEDGVAIQKILDALYRSGELGREVKIG